MQPDFFLLEPAACTASARLLRLNLDATGESLAIAVVGQFESGKPFARAVTTKVLKCLPQELGYACHSFGTLLVADYLAPARLPTRPWTSFLPYPASKWAHRLLWRPMTRKASSSLRSSDARCSTHLPTMAPRFRSTSPCLDLRKKTGSYMRSRPKWSTKTLHSNRDSTGPSA